MIDKDVKTNNAMVPGATEMEVELDDECSFSDHDGGVDYRSFRLNENSHNLEEEESDENDGLQFSLESLDMLVLSDQDKVGVDATQVMKKCEGKKKVEVKCGACPLGCEFKISDFGENLSTSVMELVSGSFVDKLLGRISETSKENSEDDVSDDGVIKNQDEELPQLENNFESEEETKERSPSIEEYIVRRNEEWIVDDLSYTRERVYYPFYPPCTVHCGLASSRYCAKSR